MYLRMPRRLSSLLYTIYRPFTVMSSRNGKVQYRMYYSRILVIVLTNQATEFVPPIDTIICYRSPRGIIKAIRFLLSTLSSSQLQLEKKFTKDITLHPTNSSENLSVHSSRFASLIVTQLIFIAALISRYFLYSFLLIRNYGFLYRLSQYFRVP